MDWLWYLLFLMSMALGLVLAVLQLPGLWLMVALAGGYAWLTQGAYLGLTALIVLLVIALAGECIETLATAGGAMKAGATKTAMFLSIVGAMFGGIFLTVVPLIGTFIGICLGAFAGALVGELIRGRTPEQGVKVGLFAAAGRLFGTLTKLACGLLMLLIAAIAAAPISSRATPMPASPPATAPATSPAPIQVEQE